VAPASVNPLEPAAGPDGARFPLQAHADLVRALFLAAFEADEPFPQVLAAALARCYEQAGWDLVTGELPLVRVLACRGRLAAVPWSPGRRLDVSPGRAGRGRGLSRGAAGRAGGIARHGGDAGGVGELAGDAEMGR
jgi:hypothetical protein